MIQEFLNFLNGKPNRVKAVTTDLPVYCLNLGVLGSQLDKARKMKNESRNNWAYHFWSQVEGQLARQWRETLAYYEEPLNQQIVLDLADFSN